MCRLNRIATVEVGRLHRRRDRCRGAAGPLSGARAAGLRLDRVGDPRSPPQRLAAYWILAPRRGDGGRHRRAGLDGVQGRCALLRRGFVIIPLMQGDAVHTYHWMSNAQFLNAVALGQVTPGPVVATVAAVGYAAHGLPAASLAAVVAFAPSFSFILIAGGRV